MTRDDKGRFKKGVSGNPAGSSKIRQQTAEIVRDTLAETLTPDDTEVILRKLIDQAKRGDPKAREHLFSMIGVDLKATTINNTGSMKITVEYVRNNPDPA